MADKIDWMLVEADWRAGVKSKNQMAQEHGVSRAAMDKHFAKLGIERDLGPKIKARADALVARQAVTERLQATEEEIVDANAAKQVTARNKHLELAERKLALNEALLAEIEAQTGSQELYEQLGELMFAPNEKGVDKLNELYRRVISTPGRISSFKALVESYKVVVSMHRQSVGLSDNANGEADKPPAPAMTDLEAARRIAFALARAEKAT